MATYKTNTASISKIEFTNDPEISNIAFSDPSPTFGPTVLIFGIPAATASAVAVNFSFGGAVRDITIEIENAPTKVSGNNYFEATYAGRLDIS